LEELTELEVVQAQDARVEPMSARAAPPDHALGLLADEPHLKLVGVAVPMVAEGALDVCLKGPHDIVPH
jgi:hypothetical protein